MAVLTLVSLTTIILCILVTNPNVFCVADGIDQIILKRLDRLKAVARYGNTAKPECSTQKFVYITEYPFGNSGNHIISLTHTLWLAQKLNATLIIPNWIESSLKHFDLSILLESYCFTLNPNVPSDTKNYAVTSEESFFLFKLFRDKNLPYIQLLPPLTTDIVNDISIHYLKVYASLWCKPTDNIISASKWIIETYLASKVDYVSVHKRNLDGGCGKIMNENTKLTDFSLQEIPINNTIWSSDLYHHHPICEMPIDFIKQTMNLNGFSYDRNLFIAYDGQGDISNYRMHKAVFSSVMSSHKEYSTIPMKYVDMFVSMHGDFFIQNPRSTFSWQIYIIRVCFHLPSVPTIQTNDIYLQRVPQDLIAADRPLWVSWSSVLAAFCKMDILQ